MDFRVAVSNFLFEFGLHVEEFLLGFQQLVALDGFAFLFRLFQRIFCRRAGDEIACETSSYQGGYSY